MSLLSSYAIEQAAHVLGYGAEKYSDDNWRDGFTYRRLLDAALRHIFAFNDGEDNDPETGYSHLAHALCCLMMLLEQTSRPELDKLDDRFKRALLENSES